MSFPRYPAYRDSGVQWLGLIPEHWGVSQSRRMFKVRSEPALATDRMLTASQKYGVLYQADFVEREGRRVVEVILGKESLKHVEPNDFIISMRSFQGGIEWCKLVGSTSFHYVMLTPVKHVHPPFFAHLLKSSRYVEALRTTTDLIRDGQELRFSNFAQVDLPVVPEAEQKLIATFLDKETAKIDALVAEQERLIELLKEKRQAVISHAVTKGLDPSVPMKHSGVEWLGEVPAHWALRPLKSLAKFRSGGTPDKRTPEYWAGDIPWASAKDLKVDRLLDTIDHITQLALDDGAAALVPAEAVVVVVRGMILARYFPVTTLARPMAINQDLKALLPSHEVDAGYLAWLLRASEPETLNCLDEAGHGTKALRMENWGGMTVPVPPVEEQRAISTALDASTEKLDNGFAELEHAIELLLERRTALISAAVTGQIDVRSFSHI